MKAYKLKDIISQGTKDLFYIWWQELKAVVKDQGVTYLLHSGTTRLSASLYLYIYQ